jgi:hypothetical protein
MPHRFVLLLLCTALGELTSNCYAMTNQPWHVPMRVSNEYTQALVDGDIPKVKLGLMGKELLPIDILEGVCGHAVQKNQELLLKLVLTEDMLESAAGARYIDRLEQYDPLVRPIKNITPEYIRKIQTGPQEVTPLTKKLQQIIREHSKEIFFNTYLRLYRLKRHEQNRVLEKTLLSMQQQEKRVEKPLRFR